MSTDGTLSAGACLPGSTAPDEDRLPEFGPLLDLLPVGVWICDAAGAVVRHNRRAIELWGHRPAPEMNVWKSGLGRLVRGDGAAEASTRATELHRLHDDGSLVALRVSAHPVTNGAGTVLGTVIYFEDMTESQRLRAELLASIAGRRRSEETSNHLASIIDSSDDAVVSKDLNGIIISWNRGAERLFGYTAADIVGKSITLLIPADRQDEETEILRRIRRGERVEPYDTIRQRKDGSLVDVSLSVSPVKSTEDDVIVGASKIARDITERRRLEEKQGLLLREMNHRVKNLFALAAGVVTLSARFARTPEEMALAVRARLAALSKAHDLTLPDPASGAERPERQIALHALIRTIVLPFGETMDGPSGRITIDGPDVRIGGSALTSVALLLHEFATNAAKYGALSAAHGRVDVKWSIARDELHLIWRESGGPAIGGQQAHADGFGSLLANATVQGQLAGSIARDWGPDGLTVRLVVSLSRIEA